MKATLSFSSTLLLIILSALGGLLLSSLGMSIGWMIGTLIVATTLAITRPQFLKVPSNSKGMPKVWLYIGQLILAIELGQQINLTVVSTFVDNWLPVSIILLISILFSLGSGFILFKFTSNDLLTSLFSTAPGGLSAMPGIAEEVGANTATVSVVQIMRVFLVVLTVPLLVSSLGEQATVAAPSKAAFSFSLESVSWTFVLVFAAFIGYLIGKRFKFPAPWLVGGMLTVGIMQVAGSTIAGYNLTAWWPHLVLIIAQVIIATSIGSRFHADMFQGMKRTIGVAFISTIVLIGTMFLCAYIVSEVGGIPFITTALAFAPGGVAEMATTSVVLGADAPFVVAVQVFRILIVSLLLPPIFRWFYQVGEQKVHAHAKVQER
ncbi:AbrB family transcriptional regulator [Priestia flexa]|uniref:AbrB family transcriptional regulator n=1 Tax=Priestia flexa TaxID=86664 RepID=UPI001CFECC12|nr:AbrB family transcriptional regulator [Priestia flexa]